MDIALIIIGLTAGEDQDSKNQTGSYLLTKEEVVHNCFSNFPIPL